MATAVAGEQPPQHRKEQEVEVSGAGADEAEFAEEVAQLHAEVDLLRNLAEVTRLVSEDNPMRGTLERLCELLASTLPDCQVGMSLGGEARDLEVGAASSPTADALDRAQRQAGEGPCLSALSQQQSQWAPDLEALERHWPRFADRARQAGVRAMLAVPFLVEGRSRGALNIYASSEAALDDRALRIVRTVADQASVALANAQLYAESAQLARNLAVAMANRSVIEQTKGIIMLRRACGEDEAFDYLRRASQLYNIKVRDLAREIVEHAVDPHAQLPPHLAGVLRPDGDPVV
jgi:transcriptional regulator with GAF, ATPase, and Fis domain